MEFRALGSPEHSLQMALKRQKRGVWGGGIEQLYIVHLDFIGGIMEFFS